MTSAALFLSLLGGAGGSLLGVCGPFTDTANDAFCQYVLEIFTLGITTGTTPTTFDPSGNVTRLQMAAFLSRTVDRTLQRGSRRAAMGQFWTPQVAQSLGVTTLSPGSAPRQLRFDGEDVWVSEFNGTVSRVHASDGRLLQTWTGASSALGVLVAMGRIFASGGETPGRLYRIDPSQTAGAVTTVASDVGSFPSGIAFDGIRIWTANEGSVTIVTPGPSIPWTATTVTTGFANPLGALFDGTNVWVTDFAAGTLLRLGANAATLQTVTAGSGAYLPIFDGTNIWVPNAGPDSVSVVRASNGAVLATLTGNGLNNPIAAAFDGQRVLVTNGPGNSVSLWKAADFTALGSVPAGGEPHGACSDGAKFWIALAGAGQLARF